MSKEEEMRRIGYYGYLDLKYFEYYRLLFTKKSAIYPLRFKNI